MRERRADNLSGPRDPTIGVRLPGFTLIELAVVAAIIVILAALAIPSLSALTRVSSEGATLTSLRSLFASARARAASTQHYVAIRFQQDRDGRAYAVMLNQVDGRTDFPNGCPNYPVDPSLDANCTCLTFATGGDTQAIPLPKGVELAHGDLDAASGDNEWNVDATGNIPATTFSVVFSPSGQIVRRRVHVSQRPDTFDPVISEGTWDTIFNLTSDQPKGVGLFKPDVEDTAGPQAVVPSSSAWKPHMPGGATTGPSWPPAAAPTRGNSDLGYSRMSQTSMYIYERARRLDASTTPFTGYVQTQGLKVSLNVYTGVPVIVNR